MANKKVVAIITPQIVSGRLGEGSVQTLRQLGLRLAGDGIIAALSVLDEGGPWVIDEISRQKGFCVGFAPAATKEEHERVYRRDTSAFDLVVYTGSGDMSHLAAMLQSADHVLYPVWTDTLKDTISYAMAAKVPVTVITDQNQHDIQQSLRPYVEGENTNTIQVAVSIPDVVW